MKPIARNASVLGLLTAATAALLAGAGCSAAPDDGAGDSVTGAATPAQNSLVFEQVKTCDNLFKDRAAFRDVDLQEGVLRWKCGDVDGVTISKCEDDLALLAAEEAWGVNRPETYRAFATRVGALKQDLVALLRKLKAEGKTIAAYGAAAKGSTLLNHFGIGADVIDFVADRSTHKQGRWMPGVGIPIVAPEELLAKRPDYCVLLTWNFADEILAQQQAYRDAGGKFIVPVPQVVVR